MDLVALLGQVPDGIKHHDLAPVGRRVRDPRSAEDDSQLICGRLERSSRARLSGGHTTPRIAAA